MASDTSSIEGAINALRAVGFYGEEDAAVGSKLNELRRQQGSTVLTKYGLEFYEANVLNDKRVRFVLDSTLSDYSLARYRRFQSDTGHIFQFRSGGEKAGQKVLVVQLWESGSKVVYFDRSYQYEMPVVTASNGLWEVPFASLERAGCSESSSFDFKHGGLTIHDARTAFEILQGTSLASVFAAEDVILKWTEMTLPSTPDVAQQVTAMRGRKIGLHIRFNDIPGDDKRSSGDELVRSRG